MCTRVCESVCVCTRVCVCARVCESECVCVCERERERVNWYIWFMRTQIYIITWVLQHEGGL